MDWQDDSVSHSRCNREIGPFTRGLYGQAVIHRDQLKLEITTFKNASPYGALQRRFD